MELPDPPKMEGRRLAEVSGAGERFSREATSPIRLRLFTSTQPPLKISQCKTSDHEPGDGVEVETSNSEGRESEEAEANADDSPRTSTHKDSLSIQFHGPLTQ